MECYSLDERVKELDSICRNTPFDKGSSYYFEGELVGARNGFDSRRKSGNGQESNNCRF